MYGDWVNPLDTNAEESIADGRKSVALEAVSFLHTHIQHLLYTHTMQMQKSCGWQEIGCVGTLNLSTCICMCLCMCMCMGVGVGVGVQLCMYTYKFGHMCIWMYDQHTYIHTHWRTGALRNLAVIDEIRIAIRREGGIKAVVSATSRGSNWHH